MASRSNTVLVTLQSTTDDQGRTLQSVIKENDRMCLCFCSSKQGKHTALEGADFDVDGEGNDCNRDKVKNNLHSSVDHIT